MATIQGVYVALFGRPADPTGLAYFNSVTQNGANLNGIGDLASTQEFKDRFAGQSNVAIINSIYQSLFNRDAETAGLNFFVDALNKGTLNIKNIAIAILDGAQGTDKTIVTNKITAADNFTKALDTPVEIGAYTGNNAAAAGRAFLAPVNATASSIPTAAATDAAVANIASVSTGGVTLSDATVLLSATISPTATDTKLKTTAGDDTINIAAPTAAISASAGSIDGGFGTDTVKFVTAGTAGAAGVNGTTSTYNVAPTLTNVEKVVITAVAGGDDGVGAGVGGDGAVTLSLANAAAVKDVLVDTVTVGAANGGTSGSAAVSVTNITVGATLGLKGAIQDTVSFAYKAADVTGGSDAATLNLTGATVTSGKAVTIGSIENLTLAVNGNSSVDAFVATAAKTITVTGSGNLTLGGNATTDIAAVTKVDASALNGKLTLDLNAGANNLTANAAVTILGTKSADAITLESGSVTKDTIVYDKADASTYASFETVTNFTTADDKIDLKSFALTKTTGVTLLNNAIENASFGANSVAQFDAGADTFIFVDSNNDGKLNLATDFAVQLTGHANADLTLTNFVFV